MWFVFSHFSLIHSLLTGAKEQCSSDLYEKHMVWSCLILMVAVYAVYRHFWKQLGTEPFPNLLGDVQTCASELSCTASINPTQIYKNVLDMFFRRNVHVIPWGCGLCCESGSAPAVCRWGRWHWSRALLSRPLGRLPPRAILRWVRCGETEF